jgi:hypothetical protein
MATLRITPKPEVVRMKAAQIAKPGAEFEMVDRQVPEPHAGQVRIKHVASATVTCSSKRACCLGFSILVFRDTKLRASLTRLDLA